MLYVVQTVCRSIVYISRIQIPVYTLGMVRTRYVPVCTKDDFCVPGIADAILEGALS